MKKVLEDELMSLAHRILKLRDKAEIHELKEEAAVLYEKLSVLSFAEKHFEGAKPTIKKHDVEKAIEQEYEDEKADLNYPDGTEYNEDQIYEHNTEKIKDIVSQMPYETEQVDKMFEKQSQDSDSNTKPETKPSSTEDVQDFGVHFDDLPNFEPAKDSSQEESDNPNEENTEVKEDAGTQNSSEKRKDEEKHPKRKMDLFSQPKKSLNDSLNKELKIGLNDRLTFVNQLFKGDTKAYESFIGRINALKSFEEVKSYLNEQIQDKYSYWKDKEDIANRLLHLIEKKFE
ncbi:hypothetical protein [Mesohalobacter halotolerans]|uniref:Uncharacterized protein n=1 Tax=Mesohalobacter halotolerans TaxID=1883405 RepID=A0A4U5TSX1_9FLAO|nr:hypothetical protein [Mesohalobacter halotolerans]TKS57447.1 hypothetical protein FCN74_03250 [Mesohalobacter halotolerans]